MEVWLKSPSFFQQQFLLHKVESIWNYMWGKHKTTLLDPHATTFSTLSSLHSLAPLGLGFWEGTYTNKNEPPNNTKGP